MTSEFTIAVHALVYLNHKAQLLSSEALAKNICTNPARVRKIMTKLKKAGFVSTKEGAEGGYRMLKAPQELSLLAVADAVEAKFVTASWHSGDTDMDCLAVSYTHLDVYKRQFQWCASAQRLCQNPDRNRTVRDGPIQPHRTPSSVRW